MRSPDNIHNSWTSIARHGGCCGNGHIYCSTELPMVGSKIFEGSICQEPDCGYGRYKVYDIISYDPEALQWDLILNIEQSYYREWEVEEDIDQIDLVMNYIREQLDIGDDEYPDTDITINLADIKYNNSSRHMITLDEPLICRYEPATAQLTSNYKIINEKSM